MKGGRGAAAVLTGAIVLALGLSACGGRQNTNSANTNAGGNVACEMSKDTQIKIATGNQSGVFFQIGSGLAEQVTSATNNKLKATAVTTGASAQNIELLTKSGSEFDLAIANAADAADAVAGKGLFQDKPRKIQALSRLYTAYVHVVVAPDSGINSVADMKGKEIAVGEAKSGTEESAKRIFQASGMDIEKDIKPQRLTPAGSADALKTGKIKAFFWTAGVGGAAIKELFSTAKDKAKFIDITSVLPKVKEINSAFEEGTIGKDVYKTDSDTKAIAVTNYLLARPEFDPNLACVVTKTMFDKKDAIAKASSAAKELSLDTARKTAPVELHPGATVALDKLGAKK